MSLFKVLKLKSEREAKKRLVAARRVNARPCIVTGQGLSSEKDRLSGNPIDTDVKSIITAVRLDDSTRKL